MSLITWAKYSMTQSVAQSLCDSWACYASCAINIQPSGHTHNEHLLDIIHNWLACLDLFQFVCFVTCNSCSLSFIRCSLLIVIVCSGTFLFSSRVLRPSLVTLCSHKSGRCAVELYHASHLWYPLFYTSPMASSALQHWTASPTKEDCHWQAGGENRQTWQLANPAWYT